MSLTFFNALSAILEIKLSEPTEPISPHLMNQKAPPTASISALSLDPSVFENKDLRPLTPDELAMVVLDQPEVALKSFGDVVHHRAPNGKHFTVQDLLAAIEETERQTRHQSDWFEGIDVHHRFFEGIRPAGDGVWRIRWGS